MNATLAGPRKLAANETIHLDQSGISAARCAYGQRVALELTRLRMGPVLGEHPERARLRTRIGRWYGLPAPEYPGASEQPMLESTPENGGARVPQVAPTNLSAGANCVLS